jgi:hypothetical protein
MKNPNLPYVYNGQIRTVSGYGSGTVVRDRVVLTAAHVLYSETNFAFATDVWWYHQRHKGVFEPYPLQPSGIIVFSNYLAARATNAGAETLSHYDVAALYFADPDPKPGRGGSSGYLASDADANEWLSDNLRIKFIAGYPISSAIPPDHQGRLRTSSVEESPAFQHLSGHVFSVTDPLITGLPGMSGGPLYVRNGRDYPAAIYLGGNSDTAIVRAIDTDVIGLIDTARRASLGNTNHYSAGQLLISLVGNRTRNTYIKVKIGPPSALALGAKWKSADLNITDFTASTFPNPLKKTNVLIEFKPVQGFDSPAFIQIPVNAGQTTVVPALYQAHPRTSGYVSSTGLRIFGPPGSAYAVDFKARLSDSIWTTNWTNVTLPTNGSLLLPLSPAGVGSGFYRLRWLPDQ